MTKKEALDQQIMDNIKLIRSKTPKNLIEIGRSKTIDPRTRRLSTWDTPEVNIEKPDKPIAFAKVGKSLHI